MSVREIKDALKVKSLSMTYADGGKTQVFVMEDKTYRIPGNMTAPDIIQFLSEMRKHQEGHANG